MVTWKHLTTLCLAMLAVPQIILSQSLPEAPRTTGSQTDSLRFPNYASVLFDKNLNTYGWNGFLYYKRNLGPTSLQFNEQFVSSLIRTDQKLIRDEQALGISLKHKLTDNVSGEVRDSSFILSDKKSVTLGNASYHMFYGGIAYQPINRLTIEPLIGMRFDKQLDQSDRGPSYHFGIASDSLDYEGYLTRLSGNIQYDNISPRTLETRNAVIRIERNFFEQTRNAIQVQYYRNRRDFYFPADTSIRKQFSVTNNIESRSEDAYSISDSLDYNAGQNMLLSLLGNVFTRSIRRETRYRLFMPGIRPSLNSTIDELKIEGGAKLRYTLENNIDASLSFLYQERDEQHHVAQEDAVAQNEFDNQTRLEEFKNNHSRRTTLASSIDIRFSNNHSVMISGSGSLLRYDTPSAGNDDDRDELWYVLNLSTFHRFNQHVTMQVAADVNLMHLVYIGSTRSANNTWNRIFRLAPRLEYMPSSEFKTVNTFEVLANYTVYDIEYLLSLSHSYVFRQFAFIDSSSLNLTRRISLEWFNHIRLYERGELRWDAFTERPTNYFIDKTYIGKIRYEVQQRLLFSVGIRYFSQSRFGYIGSLRSLESILRSIGPITGIACKVGNQTELVLDGWYENQSQTGVPDRGFANMTLSLTVHI